MKLYLKANSDHELYCEITDLLDEYLIPSHKKYSWLRTYLCDYDDDTLCIRVPGSTRGYIELEKNVIKEINLYDDTAFSKNLGCYDEKRKSELINRLNSFIGSTINR